MIVFASNNPGKLKEITLLLPPSILINDLASIHCQEELEESQNTLEGNALQKARYVMHKYNVSCFADDTGLEIEALGGRPGVFSARYAGEQKNAEDNMNKVLTEMSAISNRKARFRTVIALVLKETMGIQPKEYLFEGIVNGLIAPSKQGKAGFGYDPIFIPEGYSETFANMNTGEKNKISHRGKAVAQLVQFLKTER